MHTERRAAGVSPPVFHMHTERRAAGVSPPVFRMRHVARGDRKITFGEISRRSEKWSPRQCTGGLTPHRSPESLQRLGLLAACPVLT